MRRLILLFPLFLIACIETDFEDPFPETLTITRVEDLTFRVNGQYLLEAEYTDFTGEVAEAEILWESLNTDIISIDGAIAACHMIGEVPLRASINNLEELVLVEVLSSNETLDISLSTGMIQVGNTFQFDVAYIDPDGQAEFIVPTWASSNERIGTISESGVFTALTAGSTTVGATFNDLSALVEVEVTAEEVNVDPAIQITSFTRVMRVGENFQFEASYAGTDGQVDPAATIEWTVSDTEVLSIQNSGLATAVGGGTTEVIATSNSISARVNVTVEMDEEVIRTGTLQGTGYDISGDFSLFINSDNELILTVEGYVPDGPDPYLYLTNLESGVTNGLNLGLADESGDIELNISAFDPEVTINSYDYLMVWCERFGVRLGVGAFSN